MCVLRAEVLEEVPTTLGAGDARVVAADQRIVRRRRRPHSATEDSLTGLEREDAAGLFPAEDGERRAVAQKRSRPYGPHGGLAPIAAIPTGRVRERGGHEDGGQATRVRCVLRFVVDPLLIAGPPVRRRSRSAAGRLWFQVRIPPRVPARIIPGRKGTRSRGAGAPYPGVVPDRSQAVSTGSTLLAGTTGSRTPQRNAIAQARFVRRYSARNSSCMVPASLSIEYRGSRPWARGILRPRLQLEIDETARILVIDDEQEVCDLVSMALERQGASVAACTSAHKALELIATEDFDAVLTDLGMPEMPGIEVCERVAGINPALPVVVLTGQGSMEMAIAAMRAGAYDFITKPVDPKLIALAVGRAVEHRKLTAELKRLHGAMAAQSMPSGLIGSSGPMKRIHETIARVAASEASVLVHGETGTGKELVARRIHATSLRKDGPFVAINCAAVPHTLLESELFGHARGAFTDAKSDRAGLFVQANKGTLFLDEIGEMPLEMQAKLLRALQERTVRPVGGNNDVAFDARLITATNRDLEEEVEQKRFREDLFYRIHVVRIDVPPLRDRAADVPELAQYFLQRHAERSGKPALGISTRRRASSSRTTGRATCASWRTASSAPSRSLGSIR